MRPVNMVLRKGPKMKEVKVLQHCTGIFKPGRLTLVVGPPGGGKTMLMKACIGATPKGVAPVNVSGEITYNGHKLDEFNPMRTARYVDQFDLHNPLLTVRETLLFSARVQGPGYNRSVQPIPVRSALGQARALFDMHCRVFCPALCLAMVSIVDLLQTPHHVQSWNPIAC